MTFAEQKSTNLDKFQEELGVVVARPPQSRHTIPGTFSESLYSLIAQYVADKNESDKVAKEKKR